MCLGGCCPSSQAVGCSCAAQLPPVYCPLKLQAAQTKLVQFQREPQGDASRCCCVKLGRFCHLAGLFLIFSHIVCVAEQQQNVPWKIHITLHLSVIHTAFIAAVNSAICLFPTPQKTVTHVYFPSCSYSSGLSFLWLFPPHMNCAFSLLHQELWFLVMFCQPAGHPENCETPHICKK